MPSRPISQVIEGRELIFVDSGTTVEKAARLMKDKNYGAVIVKNSENQIGIFTERDCMYRVVAKGRDPKQVKVGSVMTENPVCVQASRPFRDALYLMSNGGFRHVPVLDGNEPVGMVTPRDMLGIELLELEKAADEYEHFAEVL